MNNPGDQTLEFPKSFLNRFSDPSSQRIKFLKSTGNNGVAFTGSFPGATPEQSFFGAPTPFFQSFNRRAGSGTQNFGFQQSFDESLGEVNGFFTDSGPLSFASTSGTRRVIEALPDVTLTRTVTVDRFVTTTDVAFVRQPFTATIFSILTQTAVTTVVSCTA